MREIFKKASPEEYGLSSQSITDFIKFAEKRHLDLHSVIILKNDRLLYEGYFAPFRADTLHRMFSVTKSFVSAAIGCLSDEGKIDLDAPVIDYFPEYEKICQAITKEATVRNLLKMQSPHDKTAYKQIDCQDWVEAFFKVKPAKIPGTAFSYDTSATHTLTALIEKLTGKRLLDYLRDKFLREAGFSEEAYCITDPSGISQGGSGLMARPMDVAVFANIILNKGILKGRQVIPQNYIEEATKKQSETFVKGSFFEERQGYGYQFWMCENDGFMCYGIGGQLALIYPRHSLVFVTTADTLGNKSGITELIGAFNKYILQSLSPSPLPQSIKTSARLEALTQGLKISALKADPTIPTHRFKALSFSAEPNPHGIKGLDISLNKDGTGILTLTANKAYHLPFVIGKNAEGRLPIYNCPCQTSAAPASENELIILSRLTGEEPGSIYLQLSLSAKEKATLLTRKTPLEFFGEFDSSYILIPINKNK